MPYDPDESYFTLNEPGALAQEEAEAEAWQQIHTGAPSDPCPWELSGADRPLTPTQKAIFTPDQLRCAEGEQLRCAKGEQVTTGEASA